MRCRFAGSDTIETGIWTTFLSSISNQQVYAQLMKEIDDKIANAKFSSPITDNDDKQLSYPQE